MLTISKLKRWSRVMHGGIAGMVGKVFQRFTDRRRVRLTNRVPSRFSSWLSVRDNVG